MSKFTRLAITHALMIGGDAAMVVALADSLFFDSRTRMPPGPSVLLFLAIGFAPFLVVAPLIGPLIDRDRGGPAARDPGRGRAEGGSLLALLDGAGHADGPRAVPAGVRLTRCCRRPMPSRSRRSCRRRSARKTELVEANSKLGLLSGLTGVVAVVPAGLLLTFVGSSAALVYGALLFAAAFVSARRLAPEVVAATAADEVEEIELHSPSLRVASIAMTVLRANVGFTFFHLAFWLRTFDNRHRLIRRCDRYVCALDDVWQCACSARQAGDARGDDADRCALAQCVGGVGLAVFGTPAAGVALAGIVGFSAAIGRLAFESIVQRDAPEANQGRAFASFETRFQFAWASAAFFAVAIQAPGAIGLLIVGVVAAERCCKSSSQRGYNKATLQAPPSAFVIVRRSGRSPRGRHEVPEALHGGGDSTRRRLPRVQATDPEPQSRSESEWPRDP